MGNEPLTIHLDPDSDLALALADADAPVLLESHGVRFRVIRDTDDLWAGYDPERVRRALRQSAGALAGVDVKTLKQELREQRGQDNLSRPA
jgi:hypothetical protein